MTKPDLPANEIYRLAALKQYDIIDSLPEEDYDNITKIAAQVCGMPIALITIMEGDRQWFKSKYGTDLLENNRNLTFCTHGMLNPDEPLVVNDASKDPRFNENPWVNGKMNISFYTGISLVDEEGFVIGSLCVFDIKANQLNEAQLTTLKALANQVVKLLHLRKTTISLQKSQHDLTRSNKNFQKFAEMISHDLKSPLRNMKHLAEAIQEDYSESLDKDGQNYLSLMSERGTDAILLLEGILNYSLAIKDLSNQVEIIDIDKLLIAVSEDLINPAEIAITKSENLPFILSSKVALEQIFRNLLNNGIMFNDKSDGWIKMSYDLEKEFHVFTIADNGIGIANEHLKSIFTLFYKVDEKGVYRAKSHGVGLSIVKHMVDHLNGAIKVSSVLGEGSVFKIYIPVMEVE